MDYPRVSQSVSTPAQSGTAPGGGSQPSPGARQEEGKHWVAAAAQVPRPRARRHLTGHPRRSACASRHSPSGTAGRPPLAGQIP